MPIFCAINIYRGTILKFTEFVCPYDGQQCHQARGKLVPVCIHNRGGPTVQMR